VYHPLSLGVLTIVIPIAVALLVAAKYVHKSACEIKSSWGVSVLLLMASVIVGIIFLLISQALFHLFIGEPEVMKTIAIAMLSYFSTLSWWSLKFKQPLVSYVICFFVGSVTVLAASFSVISVFSCITSDVCL